MGKANDSIKYNRSYPEFNGTDEGMIQHKERSGAKAAALIPTTTFVASATAAMLLLLLALARIALVRPALLTVTTNSAQVEVRTDLEGSEDAYPLVYLLVPYEPGQRDPVTPGGRLRLSEQEVEALGDPVLQGEIYTRVEQLLFQGLDNRFDYLLLFCSEGENGELVLRREALYVRMVRIGDPDSPNRPGPIPDDSTPKGPLAIAITPAPATPAPDPATPPQTATSSATATATSSATATPYDETTPYVPPEAPPTSTATTAPETKYSISVSCNPPSAGSGYLTLVDDSSVSGSSVEATSGQLVRLHLVPNSPYTESDVSLGDVSLEGSVEKTDDPYIFRMGSGDAQIQFTILYPHPVTVVLAGSDSEAGCEGYVGLYGSTPTSSSITAKKGDHVIVSGNTVTLADEPEVVYAYRSWSLESGTPQASLGDDGFIMGDDEVRVFVNFERKYSIIVECDSSTGSYSLSGTSGFSGETVTFSATPETGYTFDDRKGYGWGEEGAASSTNNSVTFGDSPIYLWFLFDADLSQWHSINVGFYPSDGGGDFRIESSVEPFSIDSELRYLSGSTITISDIVPETGYEFAYMTVDDVRQEGTSFTMPDADANVTLYFTEIQMYTLTGNTDPGGMGTVSISGTGVEETSAGYTAPENTLVTFDVDIDDEDYVFDYYTVNGTRIDDNTWTVSADATILAKLKPAWHKIYTNTEPAGIGADVEVDGTDVSYADGFYLCPDGGTVTLSVPSGDWEGEYRFVGYRIGGTLHSGSTYTCTVTSDMTVTAVFESRYHDMFISGSGGDVSPSYEPNMVEDKSLSITWVPDTGYQFSHWTVTGAKSYSLNGDNSGGTVVMGNQDVYVVVYFEMMPGYHNIDVEPENYAYGSTSLSKYIAQVGDTVWISATANTGYHFVRMVIDGVTYTSNNVSYVMPDHDVTGTVAFAPNNTITVNQEGGIGTVSDNPGNAAPGTPITITITGPDPGSGTTRLVDCTVSGVTATQTVTDIDDRTNQVVTITFDMPEADVTINASWTTLY